MTERSLAPPTEAEVKEALEIIENGRQMIAPRSGSVLDAACVICDAYLAQREALRRLDSLMTDRDWALRDIVRAALSAAPLAPETKNEGG